jgi:hypothetical protein
MCGLRMSGEITFGLVFLAPQRGMERTENKIKRPQRGWLHITFAQGIEIHLDGMQDGQALICLRAARD